MSQSRLTTGALFPDFDRSSEAVIVVAAKVVNDVVDSMPLENEDAILDERSFLDHVEGSTVLLDGAMRLQEIVSISSAVVRIRCQTDSYSPQR
jgi:hypothetical protein